MTNRKEQTSQPSQGNCNNLSDIQIIQLPKIQQQQMIQHLFEVGFYHPIQSLRFMLNLTTILQKYSMFHLVNKSVKIRQQLIQNMFFPLLFTVFFIFELQIGTNVILEYDILLFGPDVWVVFKEFGFGTKDLILIGEDLILMQFQNGLHSIFEKRRGSFFISEVIFGWLNTQFRTIQLMHSEARFCFDTIQDSLIFKFRQTCKSCLLYRYASEQHLLAANIVRLDLLTRVVVTGPLTVQHSMRRWQGLPRLERTQAVHTQMVITILFNLFCMFPRRNLLDLLHHYKQNQRASNIPLYHHKTIYWYCSNEMNTNPLLYQF